MPTYDYECKTCNKTFSLFHKISETIKKCPEGGHPVQKIISAPAFHLKGTGWYATDFKSPSSRSPGKPKD